MATPEVVIKQEPLDETEYEQPENFWSNSIELDLKREIDVTESNETTTQDYAIPVTCVKVECDVDIDDAIDSNVADTTDFRVVDERADFITVTAADEKSEDERIFIEHLQTQNFPAKRKRSRKTYEASCAKCKQRFYSLRSYTQHMEYAMCELAENKFRCFVCSLSYTSQIQLTRHLEMHRTNQYFCIKNCGRYFKTYEECEEHEYREHLKHNIKCYVCNHKFSTTQALSKHMNAHAKLQRFICSLCRNWYTANDELLEHWRDKKGKCCGYMKRLTGDEEKTIKRQKRETKDVDKDKLIKDNMPANVKIKQEPMELDPSVVVKNEPIDAIDTIDPIDIKTEPDLPLPPKMPKIVTVASAQISKPMQTNNTPKMPPLRILKFPPNTRIIRVYPKNAKNITTQVSQTPITPPVQRSLPPLTITPPQSVETKSNITRSPVSKAKTTTTILPLPTATLKMRAAMQQLNTDSAPKTTVAKPVVTISLHSLIKNSTMDEDELNLLMGKALKKANEGSKLWLKSDVLSLIDNMPQKREVINHLLQKIKSTQAVDAKNIISIEDLKKAVNVDEPQCILPDDTPPQVHIKVEKTEPQAQQPKTVEKFIVPTAQESLLKPRPVQIVSNVIERKSPSSESESSEQADVAAQQRAATIASTRGYNKHICDICGRVCSSKIMLNDHVRANCGRDPQYPCPQCPKKFFSASTLTCHMTIHTGVLAFQCNFCDKRFRTRGQRTVHHRTHTGERPFACQVCSQTFTHRETLISHLSRHIGMKRYKCYACDKLFSCISGLKMHRENRPDTCGKVKLNSRAVGPRVRVVRGAVFFEPQPEINPYLRTEDPQDVLAEIQNQQQQN